MAAPATNAARRGIICPGRCEGFGGMESTEGGMLGFYSILEDRFKEKKGTVEREQETAEPKPRQPASGGWKPADSLLVCFYGFAFLSLFLYPPEA